MRRWKVLVTEKGDSLILREEDVLFLTNLARRNGPENCGPLELRGTFPVILPMPFM